MEKKTRIRPSLKPTEPNQPQVKTDLSFEEVMKLAATTPKAVVDERMKQAKKAKRTNS
jgi:hypothetical protein